MQLHRQWARAWYALLSVAPFAIGAQTSVAADSAPRFRAPVVQTLSRPRGARFYSGLDFGSERQFNPVSQIVNEGFNNLLLYSKDMRLNNQPYTRSLKNLGHNVWNLGEAFHRYGWPRALRNELLPLTGVESGNWLPNYQDHVIGSGVVSVRMTEWFQQHGYPHPELLSYTTMTVSHVLNEVIESPGTWTIDPLTDLLLFDNLGFVLFRSDRLQRFFSDKLAFTNWPGQPVYVSPEGSLENASQQFVMRVALPRTDKWRFFYNWGVTHVAGLSRDIGGGRSISVGAGAGADIIAESDSTTGTRKAKLGPRAGIFYDRDNSLLASVVFDQNRGGLAVMNIYPGLLQIGGSSPGLYLAIRRHGGLRVGLTAPFGLGLGYGAGIPY